MILQSLPLCSEHQDYNFDEHTQSASVLSISAVYAKIVGLGNELRAENCLVEAGAIKANKSALTLRHTACVAHQSPKRSGVGV